MNITNQINKRKQKRLKHFKKLKLSLCKCAAGRISDSGTVNKMCIFSLKHFFQLHRSAETQSHFKIMATNFSMASLETEDRDETAHRTLKETLNHSFDVWKYKPHKWDVWQTVPGIKAHYCVQIQLEQKQLTYGILRLTRLTIRFARYKITKQGQSSSTVRKIFLVFKICEILLLCLEQKMSTMCTHPKGSTERQYKAGLRINGTTINN